MSEDTPKSELPEEVKNQLRGLDRPCFMRFLPDGKAVVWRRNEKYETQPLTMDIPVEDLPLSINAANTMRVIYEMVRQIRDMKRAVPLVRGELFSQLPKVTEAPTTDYKAFLRELEKKGLITIDLVPIVKKIENKQVAETRALVLMTALGRGYVKKYIDSAYTLEGIDYGTIEGTVDKKLETGSSNGTNENNQNLQ
jgi:hypothetical protein